MGSRDPNPAAPHSCLGSPVNYPHPALCLPAPPTPLLPPEIPPLEYWCKRHGSSSCYLAYYAQRGISRTIPRAFSTILLIGLDAASPRRIHRSYFLRRGDLRRGCVRRDMMSW